MIAVEKTKLVLHTRNIVSFNLFTFFFALYLLTASGQMDVFDTLVRYNVMHNLIEKGDLATGESLGLPGKDGRYYSWYGLGQSLLIIPFYLLGKYTGSPGGIVLPLNPFISALACVVIFRFCTVLGYSQRASLLTTLFYGLGTFAWPYAKMAHDGPITTLFILLSVYWMFLYHKQGSYPFLIFSSFSLGIAVLTRIQSLLALPFLFLSLYYLKRSEGIITARLFLKDCIVFLFAFSPFVVLLAWYNYYRFGSIFETGYQLFFEKLGGSQPFSIAYIFKGLAGFLISPNKSFFLYSPVALLFFFVVRGFYRRHKPIAIGFLGIILSYLLFYSSYLFWHGDRAWGPRFLLDITPFLLIPLAHLFDELRWMTSRLMRQAAYSLFVLSVAVQIMGVSVNFNRYFLDLMLNRGVHFDVFEGNPPIYFDSRYTPIAEHFEALLQFPQRMKGYHEVSEPMPSLLSLPDFWWVYASYHQQERLDHKTLVLSVSLLVLIILISSYRIYHFGLKNDRP